MCKISVVMPNYNTPIEFLCEAVRSILEQTYADFEFIIVDDCSTDSSYDYLKSLNDPRIRILRNEHNLGITKTLNYGFSQATGIYIARMDSDDIAMPQRLEKQVEYMEAHPEIIVCGASIINFGDAEYITQRIMPEYKVHQCSFLFGNTYGLSHPTAFFRREMLVEHEIRYDEDLPTAQDYGMWVACCKVAPIGWLDEVLLKYRLHSGQVSNTKKENQENCTSLVQKKQLVQLLGYQVTDDIMERHKKACNIRDITKNDLIWFREIIEENKKSGLFDQKALESYTEEFIKIKTHNVTKVGKSLKKIISMLFFLPMYAKKTVMMTFFKRLKNTVKRLAVGKKLSQ